MALSLFGLSLLSDYLYTFAEFGDVGTPVSVLLSVFVGGSGDNRDNYEGRRKRLSKAKSSQTNGALGREGRLIEREKLCSSVMWYGC